MRISDWSSDVCSSDLPIRGTIVQVQRDASGNRLQRSPESTGNLGASYLIPTASIGTFTVSGNLYYSSDSYFDPGEQFHQDAYSVLSLRTQWTDPSGRSRIAVFGDNLGNQPYLSSIHATTPGRPPGRARVFHYGQVQGDAY